MWVKPAEGRAVRFPASKRLLKAAGEDVPKTIFWLRRVSSGDVVLTTKEAADAVSARVALPAPVTGPATNAEPALVADEQGAHA